MPIEQGWVALMHARLKQEYDADIQVINFSISGDTTAGGLSRITPSLKRHQPDLVILELGANDALQGKSLKQMKKNLAAMIKLAQAQGSQVLIMDMQLPPNYGAFFNKKFRQVFEELEQELAVGFIPFPAHVGSRNDLKQADGLHPTAEAQPMIMDNVWPHLLTALDKSPLNH